MALALLTPKEAADQIRCSVRKIKYLPIPIVRIGRNRLYDPKDVARYIAWSASFTSDLAKDLATIILLNRQVGVWVYFAQCGSYVKIGHSMYPDARVDGFNCGSPYPVVLLGTAQAGRDAEMALHRRLGSYRHSREWFELTHELEFAIRETIANV